jgi:hypothetical protein
MDKKTLGKVENVKERFFLFSPHVFSCIFSDVLFPLYSNFLVFPLYSNL